jgi:adenosylcobinamide-GDP ribazoletransferase
MRRILAAVSFLTILKIPGEPVPLGESAIFFPMLGAVLGAIGAGIYAASARGMPAYLAALLTVVFWAGISGVIHETAEGGRIGTLGTIALLLAVLIRWQLFEHLHTERFLQVCIAVQTVPRAGLVALAWVSRPVGTGLAAALCSTLTTPIAVAAILQGALAAFLCGLKPGLVIVIGTYLILRAARWYFYRRIGGINGDSLGATEQVLEISILALFTCADCLP